MKQEVEEDKLLQKDWNTKQVVDLIVLKVFRLVFKAI